MILRRAKGMMLRNLRANGYNAQKRVKGMMLRNLRANGCDAQKELGV
jgi:hypothetical protein